MALAMAAFASRPPSMMANPRRPASVSFRPAKSAPMRCCRQPRLALRVCAGVVDLEDADFEAKVVKSDIPVLLDFTAAWCGPCRMIKPLVEELAVDFKGKVKVFTVDVDKCPLTAQKFKIKSIPVCMVVKAGQKVDSRIGAVKKQVLAEMLASAL